MRNIALEIASLATLITAVFAIQFSVNRATWQPVEAVQPPVTDMSGTSPGAQSVTNRANPRVRFNPEAYNKERANSIAKDTWKLVTLAIALRSELNQNPASDDAAKKAKEIEKLAHKVKERMQSNPNVGPI